MTQFRTQRYAPSMRNARQHRLAERAEEQLVSSHGRNAKQGGCDDERTGRTERIDDQSGGPASLVAPQSPPNSATRSGDRAGAPLRSVRNLLTRREPGR